MLPQLLAAFAGAPSSARVTIASDTYTGNNAGALATIEFRVGADGFLYTRVNNGSYVQVQTASGWLRPSTGAPGDYQVRWTSASNDGLSNSTTAINIWHDLSAGNWSISRTDDTPVIASKTTTVVVEIGRNDTAITSASITLVADREDN